MTIRTEVRTIGGVNFNRHIWRDDDDPEGLKDVVFNFEQYIFDRQEELRELNNYDWEAYCDLDKLEERLRDVDVCSLSDKWYDQFKGGCYWSGIMSAYLWDNLGLEEETIWERLLKHVWVDKEHNLVRFRFDKKLPLDMWLRGTSKQGDVAINTETLFRFATKFVIDQEDFFELKEVELEEEVA